jgi:spectrin beta
LEEAGDLHRFLRDLDHFQAWLTKTQTEIANEEAPTSLADAERLLSQHQNIKDEIENYVEDYEKMMEYGERIFTVSSQAIQNFMHCVFYCDSHSK